MSDEGRDLDITKPEPNETQEQIDNKDKPYPESERRLNPTLRRYREMREYGEYSDD